MRRVGLYGSGHGDKEGLLGVLDYLGPAAETSFGCPSGVLDCLGPALLTGKGCLLSVLDYLGPAAETGFGVCRAYWTVWVRPC